MVSQWERAGYRAGNLRAIMRGRVLADNQARTWEYQPVLGELYLSSYHLDEQGLNAAVRLLKSYRPRFLHAYPSTAMILAGYVRDHSLQDAMPFKALLIGSENILEAQRGFLEETFSCPVYTWYGHSEKCILGGECEVSRDYHLFPQYGITELVDENGKVITGPGVPGQLVGTSLITHSMPFIRYLTDDWAQWSTSPACACGRNYPRLQKVVGRWNQEVLVGRSGALFSMAALNLHSHIYAKIAQFQFYQDTPGEALLKLVPGRSYTAEDEQGVRAEFQRKIGHDINLRFEHVEAIPSTARGKYKFVDQKLQVGVPGFSA